MPLIMDDSSYNMDVDDLFGDSEPVALPHMAIPPARGLARRLDELSANGCCQRIAWSNNGCVAYISPDGYGVYLKIFHRDPATGKWRLGKETRVEIPLEHSDFQFVHLSWSRIGNDLTVVDAAGRVLIFACHMVLERVEYKRVDLSQTEAEMDAVVGMHWLAIIPHGQKNQIAWSATGNGNTWSFRISSHLFQDAHHPMENRPSMIYLKRYGELRLRFQQPDSTWHEVTTQLETMVSTREAFSHAAFASYGDKTLLLAAYDVSGRLHLYRIEPKWAVPPKTQQPQQPAKHMDKPELLVTEIRTEDTCYPLGPAIDNLGLNDASPKVRIPAQLTHLSFLPKTPEQDDGTVPTIQAIFSTPPNLVSFDQTQPHQNPYSIVVKWEVHRTQKNLLNPALDQVTSKKKSLSSVPPREVWCMKRLPEIPLHSVVLAFYPLWYSMILAYCYSDGTIELRNRATMEIIAPDYNTETVTSLSQAGFAFPTLEPSLNIALSPNHCIAACMQDDGTIKVHSMEYTHGSLATDDDDPKHAAAVAAAVLEVCSAGNQYLSSDDIFSVMGDISEKRKSDFIRIMLQGLNINVDCSTDETNYLMLMGRSPFFIKTLSAHHLLGLQPGVQRSVPSMIAWMSLNIKFVTSILTSMTRLHQPLDKSILPAQMVPMMIGICRWIMHFMVYLVDELFAIGYELRNNPPQTLDRATFEATINTLNKPALLVLLSSFPRRMMGLWEQTLKWITNTAMRIGNSSNAHRDVRRIYEPLSQTFTTTPMSYHHFAQLVMETHGLVRQAYHRASLTDAQRNHAETELILGRLPDVLFPVAKHIVTDLLFNDKRETGCLADKVDIAKIMFFDTTWLGLTSSNSATQWHKSHVVDVCQKMIIRGSGAQSHPLALASKGSRARSDSVGAAGGGGGVFSDEKKYSKERLRQCLRCSARTEDVLSGMPGYSQHHVAWLGSVTKNCVCGSSWTLVEWPERNDEQ